MKAPQRTGVCSLVCSPPCFRSWIIPIVIALGVSTSVCFASEVDDLIREDKGIAAANASLERTYQKILIVLGERVANGENSADKFKQALVDAEKAWIKWRDSEALMRAYAGGAEGGSALSEDFHSALLTLIKERQQYLEYTTELRRRLLDGQDYSPNELDLTRLVTKRKPSRCKTCSDCAISES